MLGRVRETLSLQSLLDAIGDEGLQEVADCALTSAHGAADPDRYREAVAEEVGAAIDDLTPREMLVFTLRHGLDGDEPLTLDAVGRRLGVTRERVRQIEKKATERVRDLLVARGALDLPAGAAAARATRRPAHRRPPQTAPTPAPRPLRPAAPPRPRPSAAHQPTLPPVDGPVPGTTPGSPRPVTVRRTVHGTGQIMVESQSIDLGPAFRGKIVSVVVDDELYRVILDGRQVTTARRHPSLAGRRVYGAGTLA
ncbi:sigma factor-like helix-turn-helix DNA-binding protein [Streptomyces sp. NPDC055140]